MPEQLDVSEVDANDLEQLSNQLQQVNRIGMSMHDSATLSEWVEALKSLEGAVEDLRKDVVEDLLADRTEEGETVGNVTKTTGSRRYVEDEQACVEAITEAGGDPLDAASLKASDAEDVLHDIGLDPDEYIGEKSYSYFRREQ